MRADPVLLADIIEAVDRVAEFLEGFDRDPYLADRRTQAAVLHEITILDEAASKVSREFCDQHPSVEWAELVRLRNLYIHVYHRVNHRRGWQTSTKTVPEIANHLRPILAASEGLE